MTIFYFVQLFLFLSLLSFIVIFAKIYTVVQACDVLFIVQTNIYVSLRW